MCICTWVTQVTVLYPDWSQELLTQFNHAGSCPCPGPSIPLHLPGHPGSIIPQLPAAYSPSYMSPCFLFHEWKHSWCQFTVQLFIIPMHFEQRHMKSTVYFVSETGRLNPIWEWIESRRRGRPWVGQYLYHVGGLGPIKHKDSMITYLV